MSERDWSARAQEVCQVCSLIFVLTVIGGCGYVVFWLGHSGWWFLAAVLIASGWTCKYTRSPAQVAADKD